MHLVTCTKYGMHLVQKIKMEKKKKKHTPKRTIRADGPFKKFRLTVNIAHHQYVG
jgi:hypothetical protein